MHLVWPFCTKYSAREHTSHTDFQNIYNTETKDFQLSRIFFSLEPVFNRICKLSMYQSLLFSMLNIVLDLHVLVQQLNQQSDMMYSIRVIAEDTDSISTRHCSDANILVHLVILRTRKFLCLQYYEQSVQRLWILLPCHITNEKIRVYNSTTNSPFRSLRSKL